MSNLNGRTCCIALLCFNSILTYAQKHSLPTQKALDSAVDMADVAVKNYQKTLNSLKDNPVVAATSHTDAQPVMVAGMAIILLRTKAAQDGTVDLLELATLFANVDAAALNASLTAVSLALKIPTVKLREADKLIESVNSLVAGTNQLKDAGDALWELLEACTSSQPPLRLASEAGK